MSKHLRLLVEGSPPGLSGAEVEKGLQESAGVLAKVVVREEGGLNFVVEVAPIVLGVLLQQPLLEINGFQAYVEPVAAGLSFLNSSTARVDPRSPPHTPEHHGQGGAQRPPKAAPRSGQRVSGNTATPRETERRDSPAQAYTQSHGGSFHGTGADYHQQDPQSAGAGVPERPSKPPLKTPRTAKPPNAGPPASNEPNRQRSFTPAGRPQSDFDSASARPKSEPVYESIRNGRQTQPSNDQGIYSNAPGRPQPQQGHQHGFNDAHCPPRGQYQAFERMSSPPPGNTPNPAWNSPVDSSDARHDWGGGHSGGAGDRRGSTGERRPPSGAEQGVYENSQLSSHPSPYGEGCRPASDQPFSPTSDNLDSFGAGQSHYPGGGYGGSHGFPGAGNQRSSMEERRQPNYGTERGVNAPPQDNRFPGSQGMGHRQTSDRAFSPSSDTPVQQAWPDKSDGSDKRRASYGGGGGASRRGPPLSDESRSGVGGGDDATVRETAPEPSKLIEVLIDGVPEQHRPVLPMFLKKKIKGNGGGVAGEIAEGKDLNCPERVIYTFTDATDAAKIIDGSPHTLRQDCTFTAQPLDGVYTMNEVHISGLNSSSDKEYVTMSVEAVVGEDTINGDVKLSSVLHEAIVEFHTPKAAEVMSNTDSAVFSAMGDITTKQLCTALTLLLSDLPDSTKLDDKSIEIYFQSKRSSGGDKLVRVTNRKANGTALILCPDKYVAASLSGRPHRIKTFQFNVQPFSLAAAESLLEPEDAAVTGNTNGTGTDCIDAELSTSCEQRESTGRQGNHGQTATAVQAAGYLNDHLLIVNLPEDFGSSHSKAVLKFFMATVTGLMPAQIAPSPELGFDRALMRFLVPINFEQTKARCSSMAFNEETNWFVEVRRVKTPRHLLVKFPSPMDDIESHARHAFSSCNVEEVTKQSRDSVRIEFRSAADAQDAKSSSGLSRSYNQAFFHYEGLHFPAAEDILGGNRTRMRGKMPETVSVDITSSKSTFLKSCKPFRTRLTKELRDIHASFTIDTVQIIVTPKPDAVSITNWTEAVEQVMEEILETIQEQRINIPGEHLDELVNLSEDDIGVDNIHVVPNHDDSCVCVFGVNADPSLVVRKMRRRVATLTKQEDNVIEEVKLDKLELLRKVGKLDAIQRSTHVESIVEEPVGKGIVNLRITGQTKKVAAVSSQLRQALSNVSRLPLNFTGDDLNELMGSAPGQKYIRDFIEDKKCSLQAGTKAAKGKMHILHRGVDESETQETIESLTELFDSVKIRLDESSARVLGRMDIESEILGGDLGQSESLIRVRPDLDASCIHVSGEKQTVRVCAEEVRAMLQMRGSRSKRVRIHGRRHLAYLEGHCSAELEALKVKAGTCSVRAEISRQPCRITLVGPEHEVETMLPQFLRLTAQYHVDKFGISEPGVEDHVNKPEIRDQLMTEGTRNSVDIDVISMEEAEMDSEEEMSDGDDEDEDFSQPGQRMQQAQVIKSYNVAPGKQILVCKGDITTFRCSAITNAANEDLRHGGGVAGAIVRAGGPSIQKASDEHTRSVGRLQVGDVFRSPEVGTLPCKFLLHAVGPRWSTHRQAACRSDLRRCMTNVLQSACDLDTVAVPAISSGIFGFPESACAMELANVAVEWMRDNEGFPLKKLVFIDINESVLQLLTSQLSKCARPTSNASNTTSMSSEMPEPLNRFQEQASSVKPRKKPASARPEGSSIISKVLSFTGFGAQKARQQPATTNRLMSGGHCLRTPEDVAIQLQSGDITQCQVDAIVNSVASNLNMRAAGPAAVAISNAAGPSLQKECSNIAKQSGPLGVGCYISTQGFNLPAEHVFHGVVPNFTDRGSEQTLQKLAISIMVDANKQGLSSLAFPSLGAGKTGFPSKRVAEILLGSAIKFSRDNSSTALRQIVMCVHDRNVMPSFVSALADLCASDAGEDGDSEEDTDVDVPARRQGSWTDASRPLPRAQQVIQPAPPRAPSRSAAQPDCQVSVIQGDVVKQRVDAVVTTAMAGLDMTSSAMSKSILTSAGGGVQTELNSIKGQRTVNPGQVCSTSAGNLNMTRHIIHAVMNYAAKTAGKAFVQGIVAQCLAEAERLGCTSIAIPALGAGGLGYSIQDCAAATIDAISAWKMARSGQAGLKSILLVMFDGGHVAPFKACLAQQQQHQPQQPSSGIASRPQAVPSIPMSVNQGDIMKASADAIVITAMTTLKMGDAAMSKVVSKVAGSAVQTALDGKGTVQPGQAVHTPAGNLPFKFIIHAVLAAASKTSGKQFIEDVVTECLKSAHSLKCTSLAIPALGAGGLGYSINDCAEATVSALHKFGAQYSSQTSLKSVSFVMFDGNHVQPFNTAIQQQSAVAPPTATWEPSPGQFQALSAASIIHESHRPMAAMQLEDFDVSVPDLPDKLQGPDPVDERRKERAKRLSTKVGKTFDSQNVFFRLTGPTVLAVQTVRQGIARRINSSLKQRIVNDPNVEVLSAQDEAHIERQAADCRVQISYQDMSTIILHGSNSDTASIETVILSKCNTAMQMLMSQAAKQQKDALENFAHSVQKRASDKLCKVSAKLSRMQQMPAQVVEEFPTNWTAKGRKAIQLVPLSSSDQEYKYVVTLFNKTARRTVTKVERVENPTLYRPFRAEVKSLTELTCSGQCEVKHLWHGSAYDSLTKIYCTGWDKNFAGSANAVVYGKGNYFALEANYSVDYSDPKRGTNECRMILAYVAVRDVAVGSPGQLQPPYRNVSREEEGLVSATVNKVVPPTIFVVYRASQSYPAYVLTYS